MTEPALALRTLRLGTRGSALARWQTDHVCELLRVAWPNLTLAVEVMHTRGDRALNTPLPLLGGKGLFTAELEAALRNGAIDLAVHSLKDLPTEMPPGMTIGATPRRANAADVLVSRAGYTLDTLPRGGAIGTSSRRRAAQLRHQRPDLQITDIRGNVDTRLRKAFDVNGPYDAVILAYAGLERLGRLDAISQVLPMDVVLPAPGQGALGVQCRDEAASLAFLALIDHHPTRAAVTAERTFLSGLGGGCAVPIAAYATINAGRLYVHGRVTAPDGSVQVDVTVSGALTNARQLGADLAQVALAQGAAEILRL